MKSLKYEVLRDKVSYQLELGNLCIEQDAINEYWQNALSAAKLAEAYPHLNIDVVITCTFLLPLFMQGYFSVNNISGLMEFLTDLGVKQKWKVYENLIHAQSGFATGEAKIAQYFYH